MKHFFFVTLHTFFLHPLFLLFCLTKLSEIAHVNNNTHLNKSWQSQAFTAVDSAESFPSYCIVLCASSGNG